MEFVGHEVKKGEIGLHADNIKKIREAPRPNSLEYKYTSTFS